MALVIRRSKIHADGVYTTRPIRKRSIIAEYTGPRLTNAEADDLYEHSPRTYLFGLTDGEQVIDGNGVTAFINHSCDPNCEADEIGGRVFIRAVRDIAAGEELAYDYNLYDGDLDDQATCFCRTSKCRGSMYSEAELAKRKKAAKKPAGRRTAAGRESRPVRAASTADGRTRTNDLRQFAD
jgi:SET domain-containing protein